MTIATFNVFFGGLMFLTGGVSIYDLPDWWTTRVSLIHFKHREWQWRISRCLSP